MTNTLNSFEALITDRGNTLAKALGATTATTMTVGLRDTNTVVTTLNLSCGDKRGVLKVFPRTPSGAKSFSHERDLLMLLKGSQLTPDILQYSDADQFVLTRFLPVESLASSINEENLGQTAQSLGAWIANFESLMPTQDTALDWGEYVSKINGTSEMYAYPSVFEALKDIPVGKLCLAHNNSALADFTFGPDGKIWGGGFESAAMKPAGWDLILMAYTLMAKSPDALDTSLAGLLDGYFTARTTDFFDKHILETIIRNMLLIVFEFNTTSAIPSPK